MSYFSHVSCCFQFFLTIQKIMAIVTPGMQSSGVESGTLLCFLVNFLWNTQVGSLSLDRQTSETWFSYVKTSGHQLHKQTALANTSTQRGGCSSRQGCSRGFWEAKSNLLDSVSSFLSWWHKRTWLRIPSHFHSNSRQSSNYQEYCQPAWGSAAESLCVTWSLTHKNDSIS